jgi:outer membrane immunogenic protein
MPFSDVNIVASGTAMKRPATAVAAIALIGTPAFAADMAVKAPPPAPAPTPVYSWTGFYVGLNAGGGWGNNGIDNSLTPGACNAGAQCPVFFAGLNTILGGSFDAHPSGFIGGGQIGYNYQTGVYVWGVETDFQGTSIKGSATTATTIVPFITAGSSLTATGTGSEKIDWLGTLRGRLGWTPTAPLLVYATGGLAYGGVQTGASFSEQPFSAGVGVTGNGFTAISQSDTRAGWTVGGGLEWMFAPQWSIKGEYLYYDLGTVTLNQTLVHVGTGAGAGTVADDNIQSAAHYRGNIARAGLNYKFW